MIFLHSFSVKFSQQSYAGFKKRSRCRSPKVYAASAPHSYTANGTYTVTLTANNNFNPTCISTHTSVVNVSSVCNVNPSFTFTSNTNGELIFTNTSAGTTTNTSYQWSFGDANSSTFASPSHTYLNSGTYTITLQANATTNSLFPCIASVSQTAAVTNTCIPNTSFSLIPSGTPQHWYALISNTINVAAAEWSWGDGSSNSTGIVNSHTYATAGTYSVCLSVTLTCGATATFCTSQYMNKSTEEVDMVYLNTLTQEVLATGIENNVSTGKSVIVSPNPNNGEFKISVNGVDNSTAKILVHDITGKIVFETVYHLNNKSLVKDIKLENISNGVYFIKVNTGKEFYVNKIIVTK